MGERVTFADLLKKAEEKKKAEAKPMLEAVILPSASENLPTPPTPSTGLTPPTDATPPTPLTLTKLQPVAPERDFAKVANSIVRDAVPQGLFIGKSKQIYDFLYLQTRGAVQPKRSIRVTKLILMRSSDIGSERTLLKNLNHLKVIGLIKITEFEGQHGGNEYEVILPEETPPTPPTPPTARQSPYSPQKVGTLPPVKSGVGGVGQTVDNNTTYSDAKTFFKDNTKNDDEAFAPFIKKFQSAAEELTGKNLSVRDAANLEKIADLLILELKIAARRTNGVSSVPAFLTEILRRQFFTARQQQSSSFSKTSKTKTDTVGKSDSGIYEIKPLDEKGREAALGQLREFAEDDFLEDFKKWYTPDDWTWLIKQLEK